MKAAVLALNPGIDRVIYLSAPAALGTLNRADRTVVSQGSKGANVAIMLKRLGADPDYFSFTGGSMADLAASFTRAEGVRCRSVETACGVRTNTKVIDSEGVCTEFNERGGPVAPCELEKLICSLLDYRPQLAVMNGSLPAGVPTDVYRTVISELKRQGAVTVLDCDGAAMKQGLEAGPTLIKPNLRELAGIVDCDQNELDSLSKIYNASKTVNQRYGCAVICTLDEHGSLYCDGSLALHVTAAPVVLQGFSGAGDTYLSAYIYKRFVQNTSIPEALAYASAAAGAKVALPGTTLPSTEHIERLVDKISVRNI